MLVTPRVSCLMAAWTFSQVKLVSVWMVLQLLVQKESKQDLP